MIDKGSEGRSRRALVLMAVALLIPLVIGWVVVWNGRDDDDAGLADARALWEAQGLDTYVMTLEIEGMAGVGSGTVIVRDDAVVDVTGGAGSDFPVYGRTVPQLFDDIEQALQTGSVSQLTWHPELGYPATARLDPEADAIDDEWGFRVNDLESLTAP